jgi:hypothetical protein
MISMSIFLQIYGFVDMAWVAHLFVQELDIGSKGLNGLIR